ncbi:S-layer homology domain-containing protein [uncultured Pseudoflavonifractor sp.]|uniref:S-layer homology domain-containing protein n=1 Tax=uncultured Pseudoflavonifractor sp. TaxID=1221379 RepID=UPI0025D72736|nr:S-layer homology domain-containing protein [uncultured Pseudoflavonifractor sp.]
MSTKKMLHRSLALLLVLVMTLGLVPQQALAYLAERPEELTIVDKDGNTVAVTEDWETAFPYGTFAFSDFQMVAEEGGNTAVIKVYRLGGTQGRAVAYVTYEPALTRLEDGSASYSTAAGSNDIIIEVENPLPGAENQPIGQPEPPRQPEQPVKVVSTPSETDVILSIDVEAESYQWYVLYGGSWELVDGAVDKDFVVAQEELEGYDFRCVYTVDGEEYCSDSYLGVAYTVATEEEPAPAEDGELDLLVDLNTEPTYTRITPENAEDPYSGYIFNMTFADGEWVKEIRITVPEDEEPEALKFGTFTIVDNDGASLYDTANTLTLRVEDNDKAEASTLGFAVTEVRADKAAGTAELTVVRTGGNQTMVTIDYATVDGTAVAGTDYAATSGTLVFYADRNQQVIEVPLIDDGVATEEERTFQVVLSNLKGDGDGLCTLEGTEAVVSLYNSGESTGEQNLATYLYQSDVTDLSGTVTEAESALAPVGGGAVTGQQVENEGEVLTARIGGEDGDVSTLSYNYPNKLTFSNGGWNLYEDIPSSGWEGGQSYDGGIWTYRSKGAGSATLTFDPRLYCGISANFNWTCSLASGWTLTLYGMEYTYPWAKLLTADGSQWARTDSRVKDNGSYFTPSISWTKSTGIYSSWSIADNVNRLQLGTSRHDAHDSENNAEANLKSGTLERRTFGGDFYLQIHTANDSGEGSGNTQTAPDGAASLTESSGVYDSMKPVITIQSGQGGVSNGKLFVGTTLQVTLQNTASYTPATSDSSLSYAVYLTRDGQVVPANITNSGNTYYIQLLWNGMTDEQVNSGDYTVNVVMTRKQNLVLDISPSVPRLTDENGNITANIDTNKITDAVNDFWASTNGGITYGYSDEQTSGDTITYEQKTGTLTSSSGFNQSSAVLTKADLTNVQWINFNLPAEDKIVYNGRTYNGNEKIWLSVSDLATSNMTFYYYDSAYLSAVSVMTATISEVELFLDMSGNGMIDGYYNTETGYFIVDENSEDISLGFLDPGMSYNELYFQPVKLENGKYAQYFMKVYYTMNPRSLIPDEGTDTSAVAQVLPAFVSTITEGNSYELLTEEQKAYRYLISGKTKIGADGELFRSSDNHVMYGPEASARSMVDVPLGGDISPAKLNDDGTAYTWTPNYQGNLLYPFENPEPIIIEESLAGRNIPIAEIKGYENGQVVLEEGGADKLNGYLGSLTANNTVALAVQEQKATTEEIAAANGVTIGGGDVVLQSEGSAEGTLAPESVTTTDSKITPDARYLQEMGSGNAATQAGVDMNHMEGVDFPYPELNQDFALDLPSTELGVTDFAGIVMDGDTVGFTIGIPMGGWNSNGDAGAGGAGGGGSNYGTNPGEAIKSSGETIANIFKWMRSPRAMAQEVDDSYKATKDKQNWYNQKMGQGEGVTAKEFKAEFSISAAFMFKYDPVTNHYEFSQFAMAVGVELAFTYKARFTSCPIIYLYITVHLDIEFSASVDVERETVETGSNLVTTTMVDPESNRGYVNLTKGDAVVLSQTQYKALNLDFDGKVLLEVYTDAGCTQELSGFRKGYLSSTGDDDVLVVLKQTSSATMGQDVYLRLTALEDTRLYEAMAVETSQNKTSISGFEVAPELYVQVGAGVGIEILKAEIYFKLSIGCTMAFANPTGNGTREDFRLKTFDFGAAIGINVQLLMFSYELELIGIYINYDYEGDPRWTYTWSALNGAYGGEGDLKTLSEDGGSTGVKVSLPGSSAGTQTIYSPSAGSDLDPLAYDPSDKAVPFQLSGYNSSGDAFKLADGLASGYEYRVVTVGEENYLLYTVSRSDAAHPVDNSMLVLSRIKLTSAGGKDSYGLVNPVDEDDPTPYIIVDDDKTGDLEFTGWADGDTLRIAWVSYATETEEVPAALDKPEGDAPGGMDQSNYQQVYEDFVKTEPMAVEDPGAAPVAPVQADYFVTKAEYDGLEDTVKKNYTQDTTDTGYYYNNNYISYANAKAAYDAAQSAYTTEKGEYDAKKAAYEKYLDDKAAYDVQHAEYKRWYDYFKSVADENAANQAVANAAAKNTVVKTASFKTGSPADIADAAAVNTKGSHVYLPGGSDDGSVIIYAQAQHYTDTTSLEKDYKAYLESFYPDTMGSGAASIREYRLTYQKGLWDAYGERTELHAVVNGQEVTTVPATQSGEILDNMEITEINGTYYVVYTTSQQTYINADGNTTTTVGDATDLLTTRRLYLQTLTADGDPTWGEALLLRTLVDYDRNTVTDGVYQGGSLTAYQDPYFSDLQFLNGKLGGLTGTDEKFDVVTLADDTQEFLLFEMNGSTYVIPQADLESIAGETHTGSIIPFFQPEKQTGADGNEVTSNTTGRSQVTIGADGAGNISAVYTANVNGTTNNALYLAKWDPKSQTWGAGTMLAMNYMQVYEDAAASDWSASETEQAYLGQLDGYQGGGMDQFVFSDLQIALGQKKTDTGTTTSDGEQTVQANEDGAQSQDTLLVLTSGVTTYLKEYTYTDENNQQQTVLIPQSDEEAQKAYADGTQTKKPGTGIYAISYGVGQQELGNATLTFGEYDFTAGSRLEAIGSFQNIGDVGIRGSEANPITVKLMLKTSESADPVALATWEITENITAGQTVKLAGTCDALTQDLPKGSTFYFTVSEDADYTTDAFSGSTDPVLTVEEKPELGFEHLSISSASVDAGGNTVLDVNFQVGNRGSKTAEDVYVQFSYESGRDENNNPVYTPLDITNNTLTVSKQEELETLADNPDAQNGILRLSNTEDGSNIDTNKGRTVSGTITVPPSVYQGAETGSLSLRVEIFSSADTSMTYGADGLITADHGEYNTGNNTWLTAVEHKTYFDTADKITLAMGNTMRLPVSIATSTGKDPTIQVTEVPDTQGGAKNLGVLYYQQTANSGTGNTQGVLVVTPSREGTGVLEIKDQATNTIHSIAYEVTAAGEGINVFRDNGLFTFYNADSTEYDETAAAGTQDWSFNGDITTWGTGSGATRPYLSNLANGKVGAYFTFDTVAESIDFSFNGKIRVSSTYPGFRAVEITCAGGSEKAAVHFGDLGQTHTVTVTVLDNGDSNPTADFDTIVEHFVGNKPPVPSSDATSPHIYWNRSFPDTASLETGSGNVKLKLYVLDDNGLATLTVNGVTPTISERGDNYWEADVTVSENGTLKVEAMDTASNRTTQTITVDWFNTTVTSGTVSTAPDVSADFYKNNSQTPMGTSDYVTDDDTVVAKASSATAGVTFSAQRITIRKTDEGTTELETATLLPNEGTADAFDAKANGFYLVKATAADGSWSQVILEMTRVDNDLPTASLNTTTALDGTVSLSWSITKGDPTLSPITAAAINGYNVFTNEMIGRTGVGGSLEIKYGGSYALTGTDAAGHTATHNITVDGLPIQAGENAVTVVHAWNQERNNGVITVDSTGFTGGIYDAEKSTPASNGYAGSYEALLTPAEDIFDAEAVRQELLDAYAKDYFEQNPDAEPDDPNAVMPEDELNAALEEREKAAWEAWEAEAMAEDNDSSWTELTGSNSFESLEPGDYILLIRDANDKRNENVTIQRTLTVNDEAIVMAAESEPEHNGGRDGSITVEAKYGRLNYGTYQFIVRPVEIPEGKEEPELMDVRKLTEALDPELYPAEDGWTTPVWQTSDLAAGSLSTSIFSGLHSGWYQVAVRAMEGVTAAEMQTLIELYQTYLAARARVEAAEAGLTESGLNNAAAAKAQRINEALQVWQIASEEEKNDAWNQYLALINSDSNIQTLLKAWADASYEDGAEKEAYDGAVADFTRQQAEAEAEEEKTAADTALTTAENAYTTKKTELESKSEAAYTADDSLWDNAATMLIEVEAENSYVSPLIQVSDLRYDRENNLVKVHFLSYKKELSDAAEKQLIQDNATMDILAYSNKMEALIPVGTLSEGDDLMAMLMPFPDLPQDGEYLVQYTDGSGVTHPVAWSLVTPGKVYYLAAEAGAYAIAAADEAFSDVPEDFWGEEAVTFAAARGLFQGVGDGRFDPNGTMTRSMLVTVLGRLAGIDPADYSGENAFSDVDPDAWYGPYVAWAAATGVVQGVGGDRFAPEDPITREQLCTMLARYLDSDGIELPELANPAAFTDEDQVSDWAKAAVERFRQLGIVEGSDTGAFLPKNNASRAEVAAVFQRLITTILTNI